MWKILFKNMCWMCTWIPIGIFIFFDKKTKTKKWFFLLISWLFIHKKEAQLMEKITEYIQWVSECCIFGFGSFTFRMFMSRLQWIWIQKWIDMYKCTRCNCFSSTQKTNVRKFKTENTKKCAQIDTHIEREKTRFSILCKTSKNKSAFEYTVTYCILYRRAQKNQFIIPIQ